MHFDINLFTNFTAQVSPEETVLQLKEKINERLSIEVPHQTLLLAGKALIGK